MTERKVSCNCCGCIIIILACLALWGLIFGVTIAGKHYGLSACSTKKGLVFE